MIAKVECKWQHDMAFEAVVNGFKIPMDADPAFGGNQVGARPKQITLASLAGCTGMDVISILRKMRIEPEYFNVSVEGEMTEDHPKYFHKIHLVYELKGKDIDYEKVEKAVILSHERYCGVSAMLKASTKMTHEIRIID